MPFGDIREWQRALARWGDVVQVNGLAPPDDARDRVLSAVGILGLMRIENEAFVRAQLTHVSDGAPARGEYQAMRPSISFEVNDQRVHGYDVEEIVFHLVAAARKATPPRPVFRAGAHHR